MALKPKDEWSRDNFEDGGMFIVVFVIITVIALVMIFAKPQNYSDALGGRPSWAAFTY